MNSEKPGTKATQNKNEGEIDKQKNGRKGVQTVSIFVNKVRIEARAKS